jgi:predicted AlkP superfamily phosphohydrolase/phosphomutase
MSRGKKKVIVIGIDGGTLELVLPWARQGYLPNLKKLIDGGCHGVLKSTTHPVTAPAWTSFMTGVNPGKHGIFDFLMKEEGKYRINYMTANHRRVPTFFELFSRAGLKVGALNVPMTYPPENLEQGFIISGLGTPGKNSNFVNPPGLYQEITDKFGHYRPLDVLSDSSKDGYIRNLFGSISQLRDLAAYLLGRFDPDCFSVVFNESDYSQHFFWHFMDKSHPLYRPDPRYQEVIKSVYEKIDHSIGVILAAITADTCVVVMSDHGAGPTMGYINLNQWLAESGLLKFKRSLSTSFIKDIRFLARKYLPKQLKFLIEKYQVKNLIDSSLVFHGIDMSKTHAFAHGVYGNIFINFKGREQNGLVDKGDHQKIAKYITDGLLKLKNPETGEDLVKQVYSKYDCYHGPHLSYAPDLIVVYNDYKYYTSPSINMNGKIFSSRFEGDNVGELESFSHHRSDGMVIFYGPGVRAGVCLENLNIIDLAPTILYLLGCSIPDYLDGRVIKEAFQEEICANTAIEADDTSSKPKGPDLTAADREEIKKKLKALGYL